MPKPLVECELLQDPYRRHARRLVAGILIFTRAHKRGKTPPADLAARLARVTPLVYLWHFFAWKLRGFRRGMTLGATTDHKVVVITDTEMLIGDPMTEEVERVAFESGPQLQQVTSSDYLWLGDAEEITKGLADIEAGRVRPLSEIDAELSRRKTVPTVVPKSRFEFH